jgi:hypothetical protein
MKMNKKKEKSDAEQVIDALQEVLDSALRMNQSDPVVSAATEDIQDLLKVMRHGQTLSPEDQEIYFTQSEFDSTRTTALLLRDRQMKKKTA